MFFMEFGLRRVPMKIDYNDAVDLLYLRLDPAKQDVINQQVSEGVVLDLGSDNRIVGIEIMNASTRLNLAELLPIEYFKKAA